MRISSNDMFNEFKRVLLKRNVPEKEVDSCAKLFVENGLDGVYTHGANRFPLFIEYIDKGYIDVKAEPEILYSSNAYEIWDGNRGIGNIIAKKATDKSMELAEKYGIGVVAVGNTNHWMRGGTYGWQAANNGYSLIAWTNTMPNMPAWGAKDARIGNNPIVMAVPKSDGNHVIVDTALAQYSYGKLEEYALKGEQLPVVGGYDSKGNLTKDPKEIFSTRRVLPIGYWKGSSLSILLDLMGNILSGGNSTSYIGENFEDEYGVTQIFISIKPKGYSKIEDQDEAIDDILKDLKLSRPINKGSNIRYPGERVVRVRKENLDRGIPVNREVWEKINKL